MASSRGRPSFASTASSSSTSSLCRDPLTAEDLGLAEELSELTWVENGDELADLESSWDSQRLAAFQEAPFSGSTRRRNSLTSVRRFLRRQASGPITPATPDQLRPAHWTRSWLLVAFLVFLFGCFVILDGLVFGHVRVDFGRGLRWLRNISW